MPSSPPAKGSSSSSRARSPVRSAAGTGKSPTGRSPARSPTSYIRKRVPGAKPVDIFGIVDDAIEHGATDEAKEKAAIERALHSAPILPENKKGLGSPVGSPGSSSSKKKKQQEQEQKKVEEEQRLEKKKQEQEKKKLEEEQRLQRKKLEQEKKIAEEKQRLEKKKLEQQEKEKDEANKKTKKQNAPVDPDAATPVVVRHVPKRSALLAMGGKEAEEYKEQMAKEALATWTNNSGTKWQIVEHTFNGISTSETKESEVMICSSGDNDDDDGLLSIEKAIEQFKTNPEKYIAMYYVPSPENDEDAKIQLTYILRPGTTGYRPEGIQPSKSNGGNGRYIIIQHIYQRLNPFKDNILPTKYCDKYTDTMTFQGKSLHDSNKENNKPMLPGRGMGIGDAANMKFIGEYATPSDVFQGTSVGNCWLLSAIASLADYDWAVKRLFRKTIQPTIEHRPIDDEDGHGNQYIVTLWDLPTWKEVDIIVDERLPVRGDNSGFLLGAKPSMDGKLWVPYLEKALAIHCGGWDKLEGGQCTAAWPMMTGSRNQFIISKNPKTGKFICSSKYNPYEEKWSNHSNSPHDSDPTLWRASWPKVGGGGTIELELTEEELFPKIVAWNKTNYLIGAGTDGLSDKESTDGVVDNHAYSVIDCRHNICGTGIDLLLVRNPWGKGGDIKNGQFVSMGPGWDRYPNIRTELNPIMEDNGLFWVTKEEFFRYYPTIYLCAFNMTRLQDDKDYVNDLNDEFERHVSKPKPPPTKKKIEKEEEEVYGPLILDKKSDPSSKYKIVEQFYDGAVSYNTMNKDLVKGKSLVDAVKEFKSHPEKYLAIHYQTATETQGWPDEVHQFTYIFREGTKGMEIEGLVAKNGKRTILTNVLR